NSHYLWLSDAIRKTPEHVHTAVSQKIAQMFPFKFLSSIFFPLSIGITAIGIYFYPALGISITFVGLIILSFLTPSDSDQVSQ
ncbi:hypothetical protein Lpp189_06512, partial [Lacticaseibacillus paracasei subsp. paracasei Lpp189]